MTFGVFDWVDRNEAMTPAEQYRSRLSLLQHAEALGFDIYHVAEHHGTPLGLVGSPNMLLAAAARVTTRIRLNPLVYVLPLHQPLRLAEECAMLDQLSGGRLEIGVGKGSSPYETQFFGVEPKGLDGAFADGFAVLCRALTEGVVHVDTGQGSAVCHLPVAPVQRPHPPMWYPTVNGASIPRLARDGFNTVFSFGFLTPPVEEIARRCAEFLDIAGERDWRGIAGAGAGGPRFGVLRHVYVGESDDEALDTAIPALEAHYDNFVTLWRDHQDPRHPPTRDFQALVDENKVVVGSPEAVRGRVLDLLERTGANHFAAAFAFGSLRHEAAAASMERFAKAVAPAGSGSVATAG